MNEILKARCTNCGEIFEFEKKDRIVKILEKHNRIDCKEINKSRRKTI